MNTQPDISPASPEQLHRCFYAVRFDAGITTYLGSIIDELKRHDASVRWTPGQNIHLTLRFLGEISSAQLQQAIAFPDEAVLPPTFSIGVRGLGAFPLLRAPRVLWAGVAGEVQADMDRLLHLQKQTESWARQLGLPPESRRYSPHVTLGRTVLPLKNLRELIDDLIARECHSDVCPISELLLIRSTLAGGGSVYEAVKRWRV